MKRTMAISTLLGTLALVSATAVITAPLATEAGTTDTRPVQVPKPSATYNPARSFAPLVQAVEPAVVAIEVENQVSGRRSSTGIPPEFERMFPDFFGSPGRGNPGPRTVRGEGSGFIVSTDGLVLTNHHVIDNADTIRARFTDGNVVDLTLVGSDPRTDVALLKLPDNRQWPYVEFGSSKALQVGDWVIAVGNPLGLGSTVTAGIISGKGRDLANGNPYDQFLQTDAAINQGNSGGPLFNVEGQVVGMNTAIIQGANTVGFAIPVHIIQRVKRDLETSGYVSRGFIGVAAQDLDEELAKALEANVEHGALIAKVYAGTPAHKAGLQAGDIITQINRLEIGSHSDLVRAIGEHHPEDKISLSYIRKGQKRTARVTLAEMPDNNAQRRVVALDSPKVKTRPDAASTKIGLELGKMSAQLAAKAKIDQGVLIQSVERGSPVDGRLQAGDILVQVNNHAVAAPSDVDRILANSKGLVSFLVIRGERQMYIALSVP